MVSEKKAEKVFTWGIFAFIIVRFFIAWSSFGSHDVNPFVFGALDLVTAWPYAHYTTKTVFALIRYDYRKAAFAGVWWFIWFILPYLYIMIFGRNVPAGLWWGLGIWISVMLVLAVVGMVRRAAAARKLSAQEVQDARDSSG